VNDVGAIRSAGGRRPLALAGGAGAALLVVLAGLLAGTGWLYVFRGLHWLRVGPRIGDSLPLLALASADGQPLLRVVVAWVLAGALAGMALRELAPTRRAALALVMGLVVLLAASQASYALARNLGFSDVVLSHDPGSGPVLEALAFGLGTALPRTLSGPLRAPAGISGGIRPVAGRGWRVAANQVVLVVRRVRRRPSGASRRRRSPQ
jgi:hypothetical protein